MSTYLCCLFHIYLVRAPKPLRARSEAFANKSGKASEQTAATIPSERGMRCPKKE